MPTFAATPMTHALAMRQEVPSETVAFVSLTGLLLLVLLLLVIMRPVGVVQI